MRISAPRRKKGEEEGEEQEEKKTTKYASLAQTSNLNSRIISYLFSTYSSMSDSFLNTISNTSHFDNGNVFLRLKPNSLELHLFPVFSS